MSEHFQNPRAIIAKKAAKSIPLTPKYIAAYDAEHTNV